ncbi:acyl-CoA thioesterase [Mangrovimonas aestuarii]|uniref:acyl-CoA thioesterase n=1 Tax=Mangrovimonas aestuarii TaxID=3018443 RepID=UPI0023799AF6|nr:thioesterase family protein [Mangrovimonas aestuarii]
MFLKDFEIRWSDVDANQHLANSAYTNFMSHTRVAFLKDNGFDIRTLNKNGIGPVVFYEHMYYFKEAFMGDPIKVGLEVSGFSEDGMFFGFEHNFYNKNGHNLANCDMLGGWIDLKSRKLCPLPEELKQIFEGFPRAKNFSFLTKDDTRKFGKRPIHLSL